MLPDRYSIDKFSIYKGYECTLIHVDITRNINKFYILQLLTDGKKFHLYTRSGRIGKIGVISYPDINGNFSRSYVYRCICTFKRIYFEKTGERWSKKDTIVKFNNGRYNRLRTITPSIVTYQGEYDIFHINAQSLDTNIFPACIPSELYVERATHILSRIHAYIVDIGSVDCEQFIRMCNEYYTYIPSCTPKIIRECDIEFEEDRLEQTLAEQSVNFNVKILHRSISLSEYDMLHSYILNTHGHTHDYRLNILDIIDISNININNLTGSSFNTNSNHMLLFHGSEEKNIKSILTSGLRVPVSSMVTNGNVLGMGIYFTDCITKAFNYCMSDVGYVFVCEVSLGNVEEVRYATFEKELSKECTSRKATGLISPSSFVCINLLGNEVRVPCGPLQDTLTDGGFMYNEYVIYNDNHCRFRYLIKLKKNTVRESYEEN